MAQNTGNKKGKAEWWYRGGAAAFPSAIKALRSAALCSDCARGSGVFFFSFSKSAFSAPWNIQWQRKMERGSSVNLQRGSERKDGHATPRISDNQTREWRENVEKDQYATLHPPSLDQSRGHQILSTFMLWNSCFLFHWVLDSQKNVLNILFR